MFYVEAMNKLAEAALLAAKVYYFDRRQVPKENWPELVEWRSVDILRRRPAGAYDSEKGES